LEAVKRELEKDFSLHRFRTNTITVTITITGNPLRNEAREKNA
jgi:hypothetical protein